MKKLALAMFISFNAMAQPVFEVPADGNSLLVKCGNMAETAAWIMKARQEGKPMVNVMESLRDFHGHSDWDDVVINAYKEWQRRGERGRQEVIHSFANDMALHCVQHGKSLGW